MVKLGLIVVFDFEKHRLHLFCICEARYGIDGLNNLVVME